MVKREIKYAIINNNQTKGNNVINESNENKLSPADLRFIMISAVISNNTPAITEYSAISDSNDFLLLMLIVTKILIIVAIKIANKKYPIFEDNTGSAIYINNI